MVRFGLQAASSLIFGEGGIAFPFCSVRDFNLFRALRWTGKLKNDVGERIRYCLSSHSFSSPLSSLRTADVSPRLSPLRDVSQEGTQLAKRPSMAMSEEAMGRWARRNSTRKTSLNGDERGETSAVRRLQHTHDKAPLRSKAYNLQVKLVLFSNNLRSLCKYIIHYSPNSVRRLKVNIISCLAFNKAFRPLETVLGPLSYVNINVSGHLISNCSFSTCAISLCARQKVHRGLTS